MGNTVILIVIIIVSGAFGGLAHAMTGQDEKHASWPFQIGNKALGDASVGIAASIAVFFIADLFGLKLGEINDPDEYIRVIALGTISGFAGLRFLNPMSKKISERIETIQKEVEGVRDEQKVIAKKIVSREHKSKFDELIRQASLFESIENYPSALEIINKALSTRPNNSEALVRKGKYLKRQAMREGDPTKTKEALVEALRLTTEALEHTPNFARAHYNRACYKTLLGYPISDIVDDLEKAIELESERRVLANTDPDFQSVANDPVFRKLVPKDEQIAREAEKRHFPNGCDS